MDDGRVGYDLVARDATRRADFKTAMPVLALVKRLSALVEGLGHSIAELRAIAWRPSGAWLERQGASRAPAGRTWPAGTARSRPRAN
jgi:hypothetical protein